MSKYFPPQYQSKSFHCPYCQVYAGQYWDKINYSTLMRNNVYPLVSIEQVAVEASICAHCNKTALWLAEAIIYPPIHTAPPTNSDLPDSVQKVYKEAAAIANQSPRAACALLRLAIEMFLKHLGEMGSINDGIKNLVKKGLDERIQQALDIVRVTGNNAVHPGKIDFNDSTNVQTLFGLINLIADRLITQPKQIDEMYNQLPETAREGIKKRDGRIE